MKTLLVSFLSVLAIGPVRGMADTTAEDCISGPMAQFGRYIGDWKIEDERLKQDDGGWDWKLEFSYDGGTTWVEVYRIRATPWDDGA